MGSLIMIKGFPCKVTEASTAKPGKHGSAKVILKGRDILSAKIYECTYHAGDMVDAPIVKRDEYTLLNIDDEALELLDNNGEVKSDCNLPHEEHLKDIKKNIELFFEEGKKEVLVTVSPLSVNNSLLMSEKVPKSELDSGEYSRQPCKKW